MTSNIKEVTYVLCCIAQCVRLDSVHNSRGTSQTVRVHVRRNGTDAESQLLRLHHYEPRLRRPIRTSRQPQGTSPKEIHLSVYIVVCLRIYHPVAVVAHTCNM